MFWSALGKIQPSAFRKEAKAALSSISEHEQRLVEYCKLTPEETLKRLDVPSSAGLTADQADERRREFGANTITSKKRMGLHP